MSGVSIMLMTAQAKAGAIAEVTVDRAARERVIERGTFCSHFRSGRDEHPDVAVNRERVRLSVGIFSPGWYARVSDETHIDNVRRTFRGHRHSGFLNIPERYEVGR